MNEVQTIYSETNPHYDMPIKTWWLTSRYVKNGGVTNVNFCAPKNVISDISDHSFQKKGYCNVAKRR